jgi:hypothetical protein
MKRLLAIILCTSTICFAQYEKSPYERYDLTYKVSDSIQLRVHTVDDINQACSNESLRRGFQPYTFKVQACSFWSPSPINNECDIYVPRYSNNDMLGHELHHCIQGSFHQ